jgi:primosomal protein N' (replication factor Y)
VKNNSYAKIVFPLAIEGPFDYLVPEDLRAQISIGSRVWVELRGKKALGYVVGLSSVSSIPNIKPIKCLLDKKPILDQGGLLLARKIADYYCCSWGEAIDTSLPQEIRKGRSVDFVDILRKPQNPDQFQAELLLDMTGQKRWEVYFAEMRNKLQEARGVIFLVPDMQALELAAKLIKANINDEFVVSCRNKPGQLKDWIRVKEGKVKLVVGVRSACFAPVDNLGLIIVDEEQDFSYKQDQVPHYHAVGVSLMRAKIQGAKVILSSRVVSLESYFLCQQGQIKYRVLSDLSSVKTQVKIFDTRNLSDYSRIKHPIFARYILDLIANHLDRKEKVLIFLDRKGFATFAFCPNCGRVIKCPRCQTNLVLHFKENILKCHHCVYKIAVPGVCEACKSSYIRYRGFGLEKIESELSRIFPKAKIRLCERLDPDENLSEDIVLSTEVITRHSAGRFAFTVALQMDSILNQLDFRSKEKAFRILAGLLTMTDKDLIVPTSLPGNFCYKAIQNKDFGMFMEHELAERKDMDFPPYRHFAAVKLRGKLQDKVKQAGEDLSGMLKQAGETIEVVSSTNVPNIKLRGNYHWQVLFKADDPYKATALLKKNLKSFKHSGIIVTVDMDIA